VVVPQVVVTVAVSWTLPPGGTVTVAGETVTERI